MAVATSQKRRRKGEFLRATFSACLAQFHDRTLIEVATECDREGLKQ